MNDDYQASLNRLNQLDGPQATVSSAEPLHRGHNGDHSVLITDHNGNKSNGFQFYSLSSHNWQFGGFIRSFIQKI